MASQRAMLSYWNGSAWTNVIMAGTTTTALIGVSIEDVLGNPQTASFRVANASLEPYAGSSSAKGPYSGVFTDFMPVRIIDEETESIIFYGLVYNVSETYEKQYGMVLDLTCKDYMIELRDNVTDGEYGYKIDISAAATSVSVSNFAESQRDRKQKTWITVLSSRGGIIKSLITKTTDNLTFAGDTDRFVESVRKFAKDTTYRLGDRNNKSILAHIASLSAADPHSASGEQLFGYDYYADPNFTSTATSHKPDAFFNYFKRATRPNANPAEFGLKIEQPSAGGFVATGRLQGMLDFDFERPKSEIFTHAKVKFPFTSSAADGATSTGTMSMDFEVLQIKAVTNVNSFRAGPVNSVNLALASPELAHGVDRGVTTNDPPEWMRVKLDGSGNYDESSGTLTTIARIQYINKTASETISDGDPAYVIISEVDESINATAWATNVIWHGKTNTGSNFTIKSRPKTKYGVKRAIKLEMGSDGNYDSIRESIVSSLIRRSNQIVRGNFKVFEKPRFYVETYAAAYNPDGDNVNEITLYIDAYDYGLRAGMVLAKVDANGTQTAYGYVSSVENDSKRVVVTLNSGTFSGYIGSSNKLRFYVPVRAGDVISVRNDLVNVNGIFLVTKVRYTEQPGVTNTQYDVVGQEDLTVGGGVRRTLAARTADRSNQSMNLPILPPKSMSLSSALISCAFTSTENGTTVDADGVYWTAGVLSAGIDQFSITAGHTATTMVAPADYDDATQPNTLLNEALDNSETAIDVDSGSVFVVGDTIRVDNEQMLITAISTNTLTVTRAYLSTSAVTHLDNAPVYSTSLTTATGGNPEIDYYMYYPGTGTALKTIRRADYASVVTEDTMLIGQCSAGTSKSNFTLFAGSHKTNPIEGVKENSLGTLLTKKGAQPWSTNIKFKGTDYNIVKWFKGQNDDGSAVGNETTAGTISFGDDTTETITNNTGTTLAAGKSHYIYKTVGASASATLSATTDYAQAYRDDRVLLAIVVVAASDDGSDSPTIMPFNGNVQTLSTTALAAGSITSGMITTDALIGKTIQGATIKTEASLTAGIVLNSSLLKIYNSGDSLGSGERVQIYDSAGTSRLRIRAYSSRDFGLNFVPETAGWMITHSGSYSDTETDYGVYPQHQGAGKSHLGYIFNGYDEALWGTTNAPTADKVYGWGGLILAGENTTTVADVRYLHLLHGGVANYRLVFPPTLPAVGNVLKINTITGSPASARLEWASSGFVNDPVIAADAVPSDNFGTFRYTEDGGVGGADTLGFLSGQTNASATYTPAATTVGSSFWSMLSEGDGGSGSRLIFEPIVTYSSTKNLSYIGYHNHIYAVSSYYMWAGQGTEAFPSHSFSGDIDTGMYNVAANNLSFVTGGADRVFLNSAALYPADDDDLDLGWSGGGANHRWDNVYATNGTIQTSDKREKTNITPTLLGLDFVNDLNPVSYKWKKKPYRPTYYGLIAQEVLETLKEHGIESRDDFGGITGDEKGLYGARYEEFISILIKAVQELSEKVKKLEEDK